MSPEELVRRLQKATSTRLLREAADWIEAHAKGGDAGGGPTDTERLDWLEKNLYVPGPAPLWEVYRIPGDATNKYQIQHQLDVFDGWENLRDAIDAAMQAEAEGSKDE